MKNIIFLFYIFYLLLKFLKYTYVYQQNKLISSWKILYLVLQSETKFNKPQNRAIFLEDILDRSHIDIGNRN